MFPDDVFNLYSQIKNLNFNIWLDGGWAVDALLGKQTRVHEDMDIVIEQKAVFKVRKLLESQGYKDVERDDTSIWNFVLGNDHGHLVDIHAVVFDQKGNGLYGPKEKGVMYPANSLTGTGKIRNRIVKCISAEYLVKFHTGYKLDENDFKDVNALCKKFDINYPQEYSNPKKKYKNIPI